MIWLGRAVVVIVVAVVVIVVVVVTWQARATVEPARRVAPPGVRARRAELERADALVLAALLTPVGRARGVVAARRIEGDQPMPRECVPGPARARARTRARPIFWHTALGRCSSRWRLPTVDLASHTGQA